MDAREAILLRVEVLRDVDGFNPQTMRWAHTTYKGFRIKDIDLDKLSDEDLVAVYTTIVRVANKQM